MKGLKIVLWVCAIACLLGFLGLVVPWTAITRMFRLYGLSPLATQPVEAYVLRLGAALVGMVGVFFVLLALRPLHYGPMLFLAAFGLLAFSLLTLVGGLRYGFVLRAFLPDTIFCATTGALILFFRSRAVKM